MQYDTAAELERMPAGSYICNGPETSRSRFVKTSSGWVPCDKFGNHEDSMLKYSPSGAGFESKYIRLPAYDYRPLTQLSGNDRIRAAIAEIYDTLGRIEKELGL